jgi:hypothetical protein
MKLKDSQRKICGTLDRIKPRFGVLPTRVQYNPKTTYRRSPKHREAVYQMTEERP